MIHSRSRSESSRRSRKLTNASPEDLERTILQTQIDDFQRMHVDNVIPQKSKDFKAPSPQIYQPSTSMASHHSQSDKNMAGEHTDPYPDGNTCHANKSELNNAMKAFEVARLKLELAKLEAGGSDSVDFNTSAYRINNNSNHNRMNDLNIPQIELDNFTGDPKCYIRFMKQFEYYIENQIENPAKRLAYLIHYCKGMAKIAIQDCIMMDPYTGYQRARSLLKQMFGQDHVIVKASLSAITDQRQINGDDIDRLQELAVKLRSCALALGSLHHYEELDSPSTIESIIRILPLEWRKTWAHRADDIFSTRNISFEDLCRFVEAQVRVNNSRYGRLALEQSSKWRGPAEQTRQPRDRYVNYVRTETKGYRCVVCDKEHSLWRCEEFTKLNVERRLQVISKVDVCYRCLKYGHALNQCKGYNHCAKTGCDTRYNRLLHSHVDERSQPSINACRAETRTIALNTVPVRIEGPKGIVVTYALIDNGSEATLLQRDLATQVGILGRSTDTKLSTISGLRSELLREAVVPITPMTDNGRILMANTLIVNELQLKHSYNECWSVVPEGLTGIYLPRLEDPRVRMILGADVLDAHRVLEQRISENGLVLATRTVFGWSISGQLASKSPKVIRACHQLSIEECIQQMYDKEFTDNEDLGQLRSQEDERALVVAGQSTVLKDGHYEIAIPWRKHLSHFPETIRLAHKRLASLRIRLLKDDDIADKYFTEMNKSVTKGYVEPVTRESQHQERWYIPHHAVISAKKPGKVRVVFDCAAKVQGTSLNDYLLQGPNLNNKLSEVLLRFRWFRYAVSADIREMFMQVRIKAPDRSKLRFLWWPDKQMLNLVEYQLVSHPFGAKSSPFCASYALQQLTRDNHFSCSPEIKQIVLRNFYVDDLLFSSNSLESTRDNCAQLKELLSTAGFELTKWTANSAGIIPSEAHDTKLKAIVDDKVDNTHGTLGLYWNAETDDFIFELKLPDTKYTRRGILSAVSSIFDPLGFVAPVLMPAKILLQRLCRNKLDWDAPIPPEQVRDWENWLSIMKGLDAIRIPRCLIPDSDTVKPELHAFSDASERGYGAVIYLTLDKPERHCRLVISKSRVAPIKAVTIPRLELNAAVLAVKLLNQIRQANLPAVTKIRYWTDSQIVLHYIANESTRFDTFVSNRLSIIRKHTQTSQWRHVQSAKNPADLSSRGTTNKADFENWLTGPKFLSDSEIEWDVEPTPDDKINEQDVVNTHALSINECFIDRFQAAGTYNTFLIRITWLRRFVDYLRVMFGKDKSRTVSVGALTVKELKHSEGMALRMIQMTYLYKENGKPKNNLTSLNPVRMDGILRMGGRVYPAGRSYPILLPAEHWVSQLLIWQQHRLEGHSGPNHVLNSLRQRFWITNGLATVKRTLSKCSICKRFTTRPLTQMMAPLSEAQTQQGIYPFEESGVDIFGPFPVKIGRRTEKRYVCIFSCIKTRAVHMEVIHNLTTDSFIMSLLCFISRRGSPRAIYSDLGTNFVGAARELKVEVGKWDQCKIQRALAERSIHWQFNPPYASHRGGVWERMIRSVRRILWSLLGNTTLRDDILTTTIIQAESIMNNRPITPISQDYRDLEALTPNHLLLLRDTSVTPVPVTVGERFRKRWQQVNSLADAFWKRWKRDYVTHLQTRQKWLRPSSNLRVGDMVFIVDDSARNNWRIGRISQADPSQDGLVRTVVIKTSKGDIIRDIRKVCLLEGAASDENATPPT